MPPKVAIVTLALILLTLIGCIFLRNNPWDPRRAEKCQQTTSQH